MSHRKPSKDNGYNMNLYRRPDDGWFFGVCAGLAHHFEVPEWMVRLMAVTMFLFTGELAILLYVAAIFLLAKHPKHAHRRCGSRKKWKKKRRATASEYDVEDEFEPEEKDGAREHLFTYGPSPSSRLKEMKGRLAALDKRLRSMERYVTSRKFRFNQEINEL